MSLALALGAAAAHAAQQVPAPLVLNPEAREVTSATEQAELEGDQLAKQFGVAPLTSEQEARLPLSREVAAAMLPPGFYGELIRTEVQPRFQTGGEFPGSLVNLQNLVRQRTGQPPDIIGALPRTDLVEITKMLDPAERQRADLIAESFARIAAEIGGEVEPLIREAYAKALVARFTQLELSSFRHFFMSPAGMTFGRHLLALQSDINIRAATARASTRAVEVMQTQVPDIARAIGQLPVRRGLDDLSQAEKEKVARLLKIDVSELSRTMPSAGEYRARTEPRGLGE